MSLIFHASGAKKTLIPKLYIALIIKHHFSLYIAET